MYRDTEAAALPAQLLDARARHLERAQVLAKGVVELDLAHSSLWMAEGGRLHALCEDLLESEGTLNDAPCHHWAAGSCWNQPVLARCHCSSTDTGRASCLQHMCIGES